MKHTLQNCLDPTYEKLCMALLLIYRSLQTFKTCNHHQNIMVSRSYCTILAISLVREGDDTLVRILRTLNSLSYRSCCTTLISLMLDCMYFNYIHMQHAKRWLTTGEYRAFRMVDMTALGYQIWGTYDYIRNIVSLYYSTIPVISESIINAHTNEWSLLHM